MSTPFAVELPMKQIEAICQHWHITKLAMFGSAVRDDFTPNSDIDLLVQFADTTSLSFADWDVIEASFATIFDRSVDLVDWHAIKNSPNYIRRNTILKEAVILF